MKSIVTKSILYLIIVAAIAYAAGIAFSNRTSNRHFQPGTTHSVMLVLDEPKDYNIVALGSSHARITLDKVNHAMFEEKLGRSIANISYDGGGIVPIGVMSEYFFKRDNTCQNAIYFIDPFVFYSEHYNENNRFLNNEPFNAQLLLIAAKWGVTPTMLFSYFQSKFRANWVTKNPHKLEPITTVVEQVDTQKIRLRLENMYPNGLDPKVADAYETKLRKVIDMYKQRSCNMYFVIAPTLLGELPGEERLLELLETLEQEEGISYVDLSRSITDPSLFKDHDHLNTKGAEVFLEEYFKPLVDSIYAKGTL